LAATVPVILALSAAISTLSCEDRMGLAIGDVDVEIDAAPGWLVGFEATWVPLSPMGKARKGGGPVTPSREARAKLPEYFFCITHASCNAAT